MYHSEKTHKINTLLHHQLSASVLADMLRYAWYAVNVVNIRKVCFPFEIRSKSVNVAVLLRFLNALGVASICACLEFMTFTTQSIELRRIGHDKLCTSTNVGKSF